MEAAFRKNASRKRLSCFPSALDDAVMETDQAWAATSPPRHIGDFRAWKDHDQYQKSFERLLRDLKAENPYRRPWQNISSRNIDNPMANWKVIAMVSGNIEAVSGPAAQDRPGTHEWTVWEGPAVDKAEALRRLDVALFEYQDCFR